MMQQINGFVIHDGYYVRNSHMVMYNRLLVRDAHEALAFMRQVRIQPQMLNPDSPPRRKHRRTRPIDEPRKIWDEPTEFEWVSEIED